MADKEDKKLFRITNRLGTFYVVAKSFDAAAEALKSRLDKADYGFYQHREAETIDQIATEHFFNGSQQFDQNKDNLIVTED